MRRMYSEQELSRIIKVVFEEELSDGVFDDLVSDAIDAYLVENPVDITALEGKDIEVKSIEATDAIKYLGKIIDTAGNLRFNEGNLTVIDPLPTGVSISYAKWSLSGTHLMIVLAGSVSANESVSPTPGIAVAELPQYIKDKIYPMFGTFLGKFDGQLVNTSNYHTTTLTVGVDKVNNGLRIDLPHIDSAENQQIFRFGIDLLIDSNYQ